jgi:hypothetical protein
MLDVIMQSVTVLINYIPYLLKKIEFSLKMALIEGDETCSRE